MPRAFNFDEGDEQLPDASLFVIIDFDQISVDDLADLLHAVRSITFRSLIQFLRKRADEVSPEAQDALGVLGATYLKFLESKRPDYAVRYRFLDFPQEVFGDFEEPPFFEEWTRELAKQFPVEIGEVSLGSIKLQVFIAGTFFLLSPQDWKVNYSFAKDIIENFLVFIQNGIRWPKPSGHLESVPDIVKTLAKSPKIKKFEIQGDGSSLNVKAEFN